MAFAIGRVTGDASLVWDLLWKDGVRGKELGRSNPPDLLLEEAARFCIGGFPGVLAFSAGEAK